MITPEDLKHFENEMYKGLHALYFEVDKSIAEDVIARVENYINKLKLVV